MKKKESQANAIGQDGSNININLGGLQSALATNAIGTVTPGQPSAPATTAPKESAPPAKKAEEIKEKVDYYQWINIMSSCIYLFVSMF